jgi:glycosyltransferase involved in cell wall biosynthesis
MGLHSGLASIYARSALHYLRLWDVRTSSGVDHFIANSNFIARRINKTYARSATVIHPPADVGKFPLVREKSDYYVTASRLVPYKRIDLIVAAFAKLPDRRLLVIGDGPEMRSCQKLAKSNVRFLGYQPDERLPELLGRARAFVFAAEEDFGISVVEAQACGTPVICYGKGGVLDSVVDRETGIYFTEQSPEGIASAIRRFEALKTPLNPFEIHVRAQRFSPEQFQQQFQRHVTARWKEHCARLSNGPAHIEEGFAMSA